MGEKGIYGKYRKAQITVPIIIGIIIVVIVALALLANQLRQAGTLAGFLQQENDDTAAVRAFVESCIRTETQGAVRVMAAQGGFIFLTREVVDVHGVGVPIVLKGELSLIPSRREMSDQLAIYMSEQIKDCADFSSFSERGLNISAKEVSPTATISDEKVVMDVRWPIEVRKGETLQRLERFMHEEALALGAMHGVAVQIIKDTVEDPDVVDLTALSEFPFNVSVGPFNRTVLVYAISEKQNQNPLLFQFAVALQEQFPPRFESPDRFMLTDSEAFFQDLKATDPNGGEEGVDLIFTDDTTRFDILPDGKLVFVSEITGEFNATITLSDPTGLSFSKEIAFEVREG